VSSGTLAPDRPAGQNENMKRRRVIVVVVVLALVAVVAVFWPRGPRPCRATFEQVRDGMTREEVAATVGAPPGDYTGHDVCLVDDGDGETWTANDASLVVAYGPEGLAKEVRIGRPFDFGSRWHVWRGRFGL
jgi:hypothetical protein